MRYMVLVAVAALVGGASRRAAAQTLDGRALYQDNCKKCHGVLGRPPLMVKQQYPKVVTFDSTFLAHHTEDSIVTILTRGKGENMKSFKGKLTLPEMRVVADYVRALAARPHP